jgi:hypothetical protein
MEPPASLRAKPPPTRVGLVPIRRSSAPPTSCRDTITAGAQQFQFVDVGGGYYKIKARHSGKMLDVSSWSTADGAAIHQWTDTGCANQQKNGQVSLKDFTAVRYNGSVLPGLQSHVASSPELGITRSGCPPPP